MNGCTQCRDPRDTDHHDDHTDPRPLTPIQRRALALVGEAYVPPAERRA